MNKFFNGFLSYSRRPQNAGRRLKQGSHYMLEDHMKSLALSYALPSACALGLIAYAEAVFWGLLPIMQALAE